MRPEVKPKRTIPKPTFEEIKSHDLQEEPFVEAQDA